ncbi:MAG: Uncharacterised protein [Flavobacteriia bacterium]|nr:MAG: Uncharacterised protein [Flavobacteriia bacterium]
MNRILLFALILSASLQAQVDTLMPAQDNTLYESASGNLSNGAGPFFFSGVTNQGQLRRGLIHFDLQGLALPMGGVIDSVQVKLWCDKNSSVVDLSLHRADQLWGEGSSATSTQHGKGTAATNGDATWTDAIFGATVPAPWNNPGGDFSISASATTTVAANNASYTWSSAQLTSDVQDMMANPSTNFGWLIKADDESTAGSAKRFNTKENNNSGAAHAPMLIVYSSVNFGNEEITTTDFEIYPNPGRDQIHIQFERWTEGEIELLDLTGKILSTTAINDLRMILPASDLPSGIYLLRIRERNGQMSSKRWMKH